MICLKTRSKIESEEWNKQPACHCENCSEYFRLQRVTGSLTSKEVREFVNREDNESNRSSIKS